VFWPGEAVHLGKTLTDESRPERNPKVTSAVPGSQNVVLPWAPVGLRAAVWAH